eukprot:848963-Amphidinium_carterae.1
MSGFHCRALLGLRGSASIRQRQKTILQSKERKTRACFCKSCSGAMGFRSSSKEGRFPLNGQHIVMGGSVTS